MRAALVGVGIALAWSSIALPALAQLGAGNSESEHTLLGRGSLGELESRLDAPGPSRDRTLLRLAASTSPRASQVLVRWLAESPPLTDVEWVRIVNALAPHAERPAASKWLGKLLGGSQFEEPESETASFARQTAALALAKSGSPSDLLLLGRALRQGTAQAGFARRALLAYPPEDLGPLLAAPGEPSLELVFTLQQLGDQRAFHALRDIVRTGRPPLQAAAALALYRHGHLETVELARFWFERAQGQAELLGAAAEILLATSDPLAGAAISALLATRPAEALALLRSHPAKAGAKPLLDHLEALQPAEQQLALGVLAAMGTPETTERLATLLGHPRLAESAAFALARTTEAGAWGVLLTGLSTASNQQPQNTSKTHPAGPSPAQLRCARALIVKSWLTRQAPEGLVAWLREHAESAHAGARWVANWGLSAIDDTVAVANLASDDWLRAAAAASTLLIQPQAVWQRAVELLPRGRSALQRRALAASLALPAAARSASSSLLHRLLDETPGLTPIVARTVSARRDQLRPFAVEDMIASPDRLVRTNALLGLGSHSDGESLGALRRAYVEQVDAPVRSAAVAGLVRRPRSLARDRVLSWARDYDPEPQIRQAARRGLQPGETDSRALPQRDARGHQVIWLELETSQPGDLVVLATSDGRCFSALVPPDRRLVLLGFADEHFVVRWHGQGPPPTPVQSATTPSGRLGGSAR